MRVIPVILVLVVVLSAALSASDASIDTWLVSGQSNAMGMGIGEPHPPNPRVQILDETAQWVTAAEPFAFLNSAGVGPWHTAALAVIMQSKVMIHITGSAYGGETIAMWDPERPHFEQLLANINSAGTAPGLFLWYQGESDAVTPMTTEAYLSKLQDLVQRVRAAAKNPAMTVLIVQLAYFSPAIPGAARIREGQRQFVLQDGNALLVSALGCACDGIHLTHDGYFELGERISRALLKRRYGSKTVTWPGPVLDAVMLSTPTNVMAHFIEVSTIKGCAPTDFVVQDANGIAVCNHVTVTDQFVEVSCERAIAMPAKLMVGYGGVPSYALADEVGNVAPSVIMEISATPLKQERVHAPSGAGAVKDKHPK